MRLHRLKPDEMSGPVGEGFVGERMYLETSIFDAVSNVFDPQMDSITDMNQWLINATKTAAVNAAIAAGSSPAMYNSTRKTSLIATRTMAMAMAMVRIVHQQQDHLQPTLRHR